MEINTNTGASTYALKKAMEMPNLLIGLVQQTAASGKQPLFTNSPAADQTIDLEAMSGKGSIIDLFA